MRKHNSGVSPVIGVLLLLGLTVGFVALTSNILFGLFDSPSSPTAEIEVTHQNEGGSVSANVLIVRNSNIDEFSYILDDTQCFVPTDTAIESGQDFSIPDDGKTQSAGETPCNEILSLSSGDNVAIRGRVGSDLYVLDNYVIP